MNSQILVVDFGSQVTKLIARRVRENGVYCEIEPFQKINENFLKSRNFKGFILSGSPCSVDDSNYPKLKRKFFEKKVPILGICYGAQLITKILGGKVESCKKREFGLANLKKTKNSKLIDSINFENSNSKVWMSHSDSILQLPSDFESVASTDNSTNAIIQNKKSNIYGIQFHPEVTHTKKGKLILSNFLFKICSCMKDWDIKSLKNNLILDIKNKLKNNNVICALSGGVDSTVVASLISKAVGKNLNCFYVDTGLMRKNETLQLKELFKQYLDSKFKIINASNFFFKNLKGITDPEKKRKIIGKTFIKIFEKYSQNQKKIKYLAQGTLYPDVIESVAIVGEKSLTIKSHHNVGGLPKKMHFKLIEPLRNLFKDEVRKLGKELGLPHTIINRHPFPGPGLAIRVLGEVTKSRVKTLQDADYIFIEELKKNNLYNKIWQAFCVLLPIKTVGVMGDSRTYEQICILRAVTSTDGMTAETFKFNQDFLNKCANKIVNNVDGINRVCFDLTTKPPGTIEYE